MLPPGTYDGKVAFVTGGGTGLGKGMATKFAELGASVVISSRKLENLEKAAEEIVQQVPNCKLNSKNLPDFRITGNFDLR